MSYSVHKKKEMIEYHYYHFLVILLKIPTVAKPVSNHTLILCVPEQSERDGRVGTWKRCNSNQ